jgi:hypothetical protein
MTPQYSCKSHMDFEKKRKLLRNLGENSDFYHKNGL